MNLQQRIERLERVMPTKRKRVFEPVDICAMEAARRRMIAGDASEMRDIPDVIGSLAKRFRCDINFTAVTCPEYERMDENAREGLGAEMD